jgi:nucleotide-binding universal stress UspA family protein
MFKRILVAYDGSPESSRALLTGIHLAKSLMAELRAIYVQERLPMDAGFIDAAVPGGTVLACQQAFQCYRFLEASAHQTARQESVFVKTEFVEGDEIQRIVECVERTRSDLLVLGIHRHPTFLSRMWHHTAHDLSQQVVSSFLAVR